LTVLMVLLGKELKGQLKTYRALVVAAAFFFFGLGTPLMLKFLPQILDLSGDDLGIIQLPQFTSADVMKSYVGSFGQIGLLTAVLITMGAVAGEMGGTAAMVLSKPVGRGRFIVAKLLALAAVIAFSLAIGAGGAYLYTSILFGGLGASGFLFGNVLLALYLLVATALTLMFSCFFRSGLAAGACGLAGAIALSATSGLPWVGQHVPGMLLAWAESAATGVEFSAWSALAVSAGIVVLATIAGWAVFKRKEL